MIIGISGGRGSGKSTISGLLMEYLPNSVSIMCDKDMNEYSKRLEKNIFEKLAIEKDPNIFSYNYYFESFDNCKKWIKVIEKEVINQVENKIKQCENKEYIIVDWAFLPLCDFFNKCDVNVCINTKFEIREKRLIKRILNRDDSTDLSINLYTPENFRKTIEYTDFGKKGIEFDYYIDNNSTLEILKRNVKKIADSIVSLNQM